MKKLFDCKVDIRYFYALILNIIMFIIVSDFGQSFLFGADMSYIYSLTMMVLFICVIKSFDIKIKISYGILMIYTFWITIIGGDFYYWSIAIFTPLTISLFAYGGYENEFVTRSLTVSSIFSILVILLRSKGVILINWNPNSIGMFCAYAIVGIIIPCTCSKSIVKKVASYIVFILGIVGMLMLDCRNNIIIFMLALILCTLFRNVFKNKMLFRCLYLIILCLPALIPKIANLIKVSPNFKFITDLSYEVFGKGSIFSDRDIMWNECEMLIGDNKLFGTGESLYNYIYSHNMFYAVQYFFGAIGYILFCLFIITILEYCMKNIEDKITFNCMMIFFDCNL